MNEPAFDGAGCSAGESFALQVHGQDMAPEFAHGDIIIVEPDGALKDGSFVLALDPQAEAGTEAYALRQLRGCPGAWQLHRLNPPQHWPLAELSSVRGVVIQKAVPGRRKLSKFYV